MGVKLIEPYVILCVGPSYSGKTYWIKSQNLKREEDRDFPATDLIISRDPLREMLFGYDHDTVENYYMSGNIKETEKLVTDVSDSIILNNIGRNFVIDNTHLSLYYIDHYVKLLQMYDYNIYLRVFPINLELAEFRSVTRKRYVDMDIVRKQILRTKQLLESLRLKLDVDNIYPNQYVLYHRSFHQPLIYPGHIRNKSCIVLDLDNTLAFNKSGRSIYDWSKVHLDEGNSNLMDTISHNVNICFVSGRSSECYQATEDWFHENFDHYKSPKYRLQELHFRNRGDFRPAWQVKEELWADVAKSYNIMMIFDDDPKVIEHANRLGYNTALVNFKI